MVWLKLGGKKIKIIISIIITFVLVQIALYALHFSGLAGTSNSILNNFSQINAERPGFITLFGMPLPVSLFLPQPQQATPPPQPTTDKDSSNFNNSGILSNTSPYSEYSRYNRKNIPLSPDYQTSHKYDSTSKEFYRTETFGGANVNYPYSVDLDSYLGNRKNAMQSSIRDSLEYHYDLGTALTGGDLSRMMNTATGLTIPVPPNPVIGLFGKPEIKIDVRGEAVVKAGWRWDSQNVGSESAFGSTQSSPIFSQDIKINASVQLGDKLKLNTDWNTRTQTEFNNKFKIGYEGEDDEIIKLVEVGNVSLPVSNTLIGGGQTLFGIRADFQFGGLFLKTILSQKRGERRFVDVKGGATKQYIIKRAYDYAKNHFFLDEAYKPFYKESFKSGTKIIPPSASYYRIKQIQVFESTENIQQGSYSSQVVALADLDPGKTKAAKDFPASMKTAQILAGEVQRGLFQLLDSNRVQVDYNLGTITIQNMKTNLTYAAAYKIEGPTTSNDDDLYVGSLSVYAEAKDTLILKLISMPGLQPGFKKLWSRMMKNIYQMDASNVNTKDTKISLWYINQNNDSTDVLEGAPDKLVTIMRVDQVNNSSGQPPPDGLFDLQPPFFDAYRGEITFPSLEPFRDGLRDYFTKQGAPQTAEQYIFNEVYDENYDVARKNTARDRFVIVGEMSGTASNRISLGAINLAPNSVRVLLDGVPLREYQDYTVDLFSGTLTLLNQRALLPNANLKIEYEQSDMFNLTTKTLAGLRADYQILKSRTANAGLGFTIMHYDQSAQVDQVRPGEEPNANTMIGFDGKLNWDLPWLTKWIDYLPFYDTKAPSSLSARGEWAIVLPDPNKRDSEIYGDNGLPVAYVDNFENVQRNISLSLTPVQWTHSSQPQETIIGADDVERAKFRSQLFWFKQFLPDIDVSEVYPNRTTTTGNHKTTAMHISFDPSVRGIYNMNPEFVDAKNPEYKGAAAFAASFLEPNKDRLWGGMTRMISSFSTNFENDNVEYIEIMMRKHNTNCGKMYIDLGQISEDIIPNQRLDSEDGSTPGNPVPNNIIDPGEDVGIDTLDNAKEKLRYPYPLNLEADPARDDYYFNFNKTGLRDDWKDFEKYNNFENNASYSETGQTPDGEILNKNNALSPMLDNSYFTYEVDLTTAPKDNPQIVGGSGDGDPKGWYLYRIPIRKPAKVTGNPSLTNIQYIRVWFRGGPVYLDVVDWKLVGSQWQRNSNLQAVAADDSVLEVTYVNREENSGAPDYYDLPPGVTPPKQLNSSDPYTTYYLNEQSLALKVKNLRYGEERMAVKFTRPWDIFYYKKMKFFVHGDGSMPESMLSGSVPKGYMFFRFGTDSMNYYEYRRPLLRNWQSVEMNLADLAAIKQTRDSASQTIRVSYDVPNDPLASYAIRGNPVLTKVQFWGFGIGNPSERFPNELTTTAWVDELRLLDPESSADWAGVGNVELKLADLGTVNANISYQQPNFHRLEERFGNRTESTNWGVAVTGNLEKFAPKEFSEMKIPISYSHNEHVEDPEYVANSDVKLDEAAAAAKQKAYAKAIKEGKTPEAASSIAEQVSDATIVKSQTLRVNDGWALTGVKLGIPSSSWLIKETINKVTVGYSYSQEWERSPIVQERFSWVWVLNAQYSVSIPELLTLKPYGFVKDAPVVGLYSDLKYNFLPKTFSAGLTMTRRRTTEQSRYLSYPSPVLRDFMATRTASFNWALAENGIINPVIDYSFSTGSTLVPLELDASGKQRTGSEIASKIFFKEGLINLGTNNTHTQNLTINFRPRLPLGPLQRFVDMAGSYSSIYNWQDPLQSDPAIADVVRRASVNATLRFTTNLKLKAYGEQLFGISSSKRPMNLPRTGPDGKMLPPEQQAPDSTSGKDGFWWNVAKITKMVFFDFDKVDFSVNQTNTMNNPGVFGGTGMTNFWARGLTFRPSEIMYGPSMAYQLGLVTDPHGGFDLVGSDRFPFFGFSTYPGLRPANGIMQDMFNQKTTMDVKTSRPLWEGATLDLTWKTEVGFGRTQTVVTESNGVPKFTNIIITESYSRTYLTIPSVFGLNVFNNNVEHVIDLYKAKKAKIMAENIETGSKNLKLQQALSESLHEGMEAFSIFGGGSIGKFLPAVNWSIRWEGIEKWDMWGKIAKKITLEHAYKSTYTENASVNNGERSVTTQQIQHGWSPLVGINTTFDEKKLDGVLTANLRWNSTNNYQFRAANRSTIVRQAQDELQLNASYMMKGFEFPLFNIMLKNEVEFSFMASYKRNKNATYDISGVDDYGGEDGRKLDGNTQIVIEPRARYSMSDKVSASFFIRYESTINEGANSPGFSTFQTGLEIRISLSGGR